MNPSLARRLTALKKLLPGEIVLAPSVLQQYAGDKWFATHEPDAVALPRSTQSVATILRFANRHAIPVTARGAGHGYVGGCVPVRGGIVLSLERMNRIVEINAGDFVVVTQPGVITATLQNAVEKQKLFYPPDPASRKESFIGGNIVTNAGGPRCLKYGVTRDYVLGLEVVLADGTIVRLGSRTHKNKTGFDLHRLFVGSEGLARGGDRSHAQAAAAAALPREPRHRIFHHARGDSFAARHSRCGFSARRFGARGFFHARRRLQTDQE